MGELEVSKIEALRTQANRRILGAARASVAPDQEWDFLCECGRPDCYEYVTLTVHAYSVIRDGGGAVLARGHRLSQVERARRLQAEAEALRAQARHQVKRAKKNLGGSSDVVSDAAGQLTDEQLEAELTILVAHPGLAERYEALLAEREDRRHS